MKDLHIKFRQETGRSAVCDPILIGKEDGMAVFYENDFPDEYKGPRLILHSLEYIHWLEGRLERLENG
jgi:hypothetical protein